MGCRLLSGFATQFPPAHRKELLETNRLLVKPCDVQLKQTLHRIGIESPVLLPFEEVFLPPQEMQRQARGPVRIASRLKCRIEMLHEIQVHASTGDMDAQVQSRRSNHVQIGVVAFRPNHTANRDVLPA